MANPEIPSFKNPLGGGGEPPKDPPGPPLPKGGSSSSGSDEKKGSGLPLFGKTAPKAPSFGGTAPAAGGAPSLKIRGLAGGPKTLFERLKQFQKKDLVFIASGMGVLFLAPLAEHFMMSPTQDSAALKGGFGGSGAGPFNGEIGPSDSTGGLGSPGGLYGASTDVITPLNVRDPSALVMAPGASQVTPPPAATTVAPPAASSSRDSGGWKDALSAAKSGVEKGADAAKPAAFKAPGNLAGALRGLSALSGGSYGGGPSFNLGAPNASNVPNRSGEGGRLSQVKSAPGYKGVGQRGLDSGGGGAEALRKAAEGQGNLFNRPGSAAGNLDAAAREAIPTGSGQGGGGAGSGGENKGGSGSTSKDNKALGESLAYLRMKMEMEKEMDLKWAKKKWKEFEFPKMIYEEITKSAIQNIVGKGMFEPLGKGMANMWAGKAGAPAGVYCTNNKQTIDLANDDSVAYHCGGSKGAYSRAKKDGEETGPIQDVGCEICTEYGGGAKPAPPGGSGGGTTNRPGSSPGTVGQSPAQEAERIGQDIGTGSDKLKGFLTTCQGSQDVSLRDRMCPQARLLAPLYDFNGQGLLTKAKNANTDSGKALEDAWAAMRVASEKMQASEEKAFEAANKLGCSDKGTRKGCGDKTAMAKAAEAAKLLGEANALAVKAQTPPIGDNLKNAQAKYDEAYAALEAAKAWEWGKDDRAAILTAMDLAKTKLTEATTKAREGGGYIEQAATALYNSQNGARWQNNESSTMREHYWGPAASAIDSARNPLSEKAGEAGRTGKAGDPIVTERSTRIGHADAVRLKRMEEMQKLACGDCAEAGAAPPGGNAESMVRTAIMAYKGGQAIKDEKLEKTAPTTVPAMIKVTGEVSASLDGKVKKLNDELLPPFDKAMSKVHNRDGGKPEEDVRGLALCAGTMTCTAP